jgi:hypothetical protein
MEFDVLLPSLQDPATGPHPEPDGSDKRFQSNFPNIHFNIILLPAPTSSKWSLPSRNFVDIFYTYIP